MIEDEWEQVPISYHDYEVKKMDSIKFFACPLTTISGNSWELMRQVNLCCSVDGTIRHLPEPAESVLNQSPKFLTAVEIVKSERNSDWIYEKQQQWAKDKAR